MATAIPGDPDLLIDAVLSRVASHMTHLAEKLASTETAVSEHFKEVLADDLDAFQDVQNLDYLHQSMTDTAKLLSSLSEGCRTQLDLIEQLKLETTRALVRGSENEEAVVVSGSIDLF